ncbi:MAG: class I SAM-dependent methyltransferase [bacterium]|nr:class I SAM-dependent methyltransferase [bacterium]
MYSLFLAAMISGFLKISGITIPSKNGYPMETYNSDLPKIEEFIEFNGKALLDIGCGDGRLTGLLAGKADAITAIDPDESSIEAARRNINGVDFLVGSGEELEFANETFDIVLFSYSLHHQDCIKALAEARRVVRQDGQILIIEPHHDGEFTRLVSIFEKDEITLLHKTLGYITSGSVDIIRRDAYCVDHSYEDENELYTHFKAKFMAEKNDQAVEKMQSIIGNKNRSRPIIIQDVVNIFLISPH